MRSPIPYASDINHYIALRHQDARKTGNPVHPVQNLTGTLFGLLLAFAITKFARIKGKYRKRLFLLDITAYFLVKSTQ